jgi:hypothetical protein
MHRPVGTLLVLALCAVGVAAGQAPVGQDRIPVLAELFTSEGCSSCPPADRLLEWLSKEQPVEGVYVIAMSEHVTYWDHQGWKDPFGSTKFTERQQMYARRLGGDIFTPQLIIDGKTPLIGSDTNGLKRALTEALLNPKPRLSVEASLTASGDVSGTASGPGLQAGADEDADVLWALTEDDLAVDVRRGENAKRTLQHSGVVRSLVTKKREPGGAEPMTMVTRAAREWKPANLRLIVFVQAAKSKRVLSVSSARVVRSAPRD